MRAAKVVTRGAFDIGSGATKLQIASVDVANGRIVQHMFGQERPVSFGLDMLRGGRNILSDEIMTKVTLLTASSPLTGI